MWAFGFAGLGVKEIDPLLLREGTSSWRWQPTADALFTMYFPRQRVATYGNGFGLISPVTGAGELRPIATRCNHGAP